MIARSILFRPGGRLACELAHHGVILRINDWVFCHGGLLPHHGKICLSVLLPCVWDTSVVLYGLKCLIGVLVLPQLHTA